MEAILAALGVAFVAVAAAVVLVRRRFVVVNVVGVSMTPTLRAGQRVLVRRVPFHTLRPGQIVVLSFPPGVVEGEDTPAWMVKRVLAVSGDPVPRDEVATLRDEPGERVPAGRFVVVGDNPARSLDSRTFGYARADMFLGTVTRSMGS
jgi:signal peptidase I